MRFDDAIRTYGRLQRTGVSRSDWMIKVAELQARSGRNSGGERAKTAILGARTETAEADFEIARASGRMAHAARGGDLRRRGAALPRRNLRRAPTMRSIRASWRGPAGST